MLILLSEVISTQTYDSVLLKQQSLCFCDVLVIIPLTFANIFLTTDIIKFEKGQCETSKSSSDECSQ